MIVDAHAHVYPRVHGRIGAGPTRGWRLGQVRVGEEVIRVMPPLNEEVMHTPDMLIAAMDWAGVDKAVLLHGPFYGECNAYAAAAVRAHPHRLVAAAYLDPWADEPLNQLRKIIDEQVFLGVKIECSDAAGLCGIHPEARLDDLALAPLWKQLEQSGLVLTLDLGAIGGRSYQTEAVRTIAQEHPALRVVIAHLAQPRPGMCDSEMKAWRAQLDLGQLPNVWFDTASLPAYGAPQPYPFMINRDWLRETVDQIGVDKILYGTDTPGLLVHANYPQLLEAFRTQIAFLSNEDQNKLLGGNARQAYGV
jgi:predicted TIM-barrel fold metal-dependent hydrolase